MSIYSQHVANNILPLSMAKSLSDAFNEWYFTDAIEDHLDATETCQLCDQEELRYHFEIKNKLTRKTLWVGSSCILKFKVSIFDNNGQVLDIASSKKKLESLKEKMRKDSCIKTLRQIAEHEKHEILIGALNYYLKNNYLTPKFAAVLFWRLSKNDIDYSPSFFKISLKTKQFKQDLAEMETYKVHNFWPALTSNQKKLAENLGHTPPKNK